MSEFKEILASEFGAFRTLSERELEVLERHHELLVRWNQKINLTRIVELRDAIRFHYCESLFLALKMPPGRLSIADIGSGAGFPGLPIAVVRPDCTVTLIESDQRKSVFLREVARGLQNVRVVATRAEDVPGKFDWVVSRAVSRQDLLNVTLAPKIALLTVGDQGEVLPWGNRRCLEIVSRETLS